MFTDIGIDLGTYKIIVYVKNRGIIFHEPSVIAYNKKTKQIVAVGKSAYKMIGKTPSYIKTVRPILKGVICDYDFAEKRASEIRKEYENRFFRRLLARACRYRARFVVCSCCRKCSQIEGIAGFINSNFYSISRNMLSIYRSGVGEAWGDEAEVFDMGRYSAK